MLGAISKNVQWLNIPHLPLISDKFVPLDNRKSGRVSHSVSEPVRRELERCLSKMWVPLVVGLMFGVSFRICDFEFLVWLVGKRICVFVLGFGI